MTRFGMMFDQGDIVVVPFPFSNLSSVKQRPVLVLSNSDYNNKTEDLITCGITSNIENKEHSIIFDNFDLTEGRLPLKSRIKVDKLFTISRSLIRKKVAKLKPNKITEVKSELYKLF